MECFFYLAFNFVLYSFLGWCLEEVYSFFIQGYFKKDGFLKGPFKPMYGTALCILDFCIEGLEINNKFLFIVLVVTVPTFIEFISGYLLKKYFKEVYWNYRDNKFNYKGIICAKFSFYWSIISALVIIYIQPFVHEIYIYYNDVTVLLSLLLGGYILMDFVNIMNKYFNRGLHFTLR